MLGLYALFLVLPYFKPLAVLINVDLPAAINLIWITFVNDLVFWVNQVDAHIHKLLIIVFVGAVEPVLPVEEVLIDLSLWK